MLPPKGSVKNFSSVIKKYSAYISWHLVSSGPNYLVVVVGGQIDAHHLLQQFSETPV